MNEDCRHCVVSNTGVLMVFCHVYQDKSGLNLPNPTKKISPPLGCTLVLEGSSFINCTVLVDRDELAKGVQINHTWLDSFILGQYGLKSVLVLGLEPYKSCA